MVKLKLPSGISDPQKRDYSHFVYAHKPPADLFTIPHIISGCFSSTIHRHSPSLYYVLYINTKIIINVKKRRVIPNFHSPAPTTALVNCYQHPVVRIKFALLVQKEAIHFRVPTAHNIWINWSPGEY